MIGIVAEYNPFHQGHRFHIEESKRLIGNDEPVCAVMSGDFVQRGEIAIRDKFQRARLACEGGVDLVIELPLPWSLSSAEGFARGAVSILERMRCEYLSFGSECGDIEALKSCAEHFNPEAIRGYLREHPNCTWPTARAAVEADPLLDEPNNLLAVEYLKSTNLPCITIKRMAPHDGPGSAKEIRESIGNDFDEAVFLSRLQMFDREYFNSLPDAKDGSGDRLYHAVHSSRSLERIYAATKTKRYTMSHIRRLTMCAVLGVMDDFRGKEPPYARILAFNERGREVLKGKFELPLLVRPKDVRKLDPFSQKVFALGASANDFYYLAKSGSMGPTCGFDYTKGPEIV